MIDRIQDVHVQELCILAQGDESVLEYHLPDAICGFHAQQSTEKLFKALISAHGGTYPFTHSLEKLVEILDQDYAEKLPVLPYDLLLVEPYAVKLRYTVGSFLSDTARQEIRESVALLREHIIGRILAIESSRPQQLFGEL